MNRNSLSPFAQWMRAVCFTSLLAGSAPSPTAAQTIQPVIVEFTEKADGRFEVANDTLEPMAVVLEAKSFSITEEGRGVYRALDAGIHVKLSTSSFRLEPKQSSLVFYKATSDSLPAWFTVYATFAPIRPSAPSGIGKSGEGMSVRVMLPHTVYLYQKKPIEKGSIHVRRASFPMAGDAVECDLHNDGPALVRVQEVRAIAGKTSVAAAGFPLLPGAVRHVSIDWKEKTRPEYLLFRFPHFDLREPLTSARP